MLMKFAQTKDGLQESIELWQAMKNADRRNGRRHINLDNFIQLDCSYCAYIVEGHLYKGYFTKEDIEDIDKVLDYHKGRIRSLNG